MGFEDRKLLLGHKSEETRLRDALAERDTKGLDARRSGNAWRRQRHQDPLPEAKRFTDHLTPAVLLSMKTGLRRGELLSLLSTDIDLEERLLTVRGATARSGDTRYIPLNNEAAESERVFPVTTSFKTAWRVSLERAELTRFRWHDVRHHFASRLVQAGVPLNTARELLGHGTLTMTLRYAHLAPNQTRDAVSRLVPAHSLSTSSPE